MVKKMVKRYQKASLTVEAALVLPLFLYFMLAFLYFIQIYTVQEQIQSAITAMGLNLSKASYILRDFPDMEDALSFDFTILNKEIDFSLAELADEQTGKILLKPYAEKYLDNTRINRSCIKDGFDGIKFYGSGNLNSGDYLDIIVSYQVEIPIKIFLLNSMQMIQRVRLRKWTGCNVAAVYQSEQTADGGTIVYITNTGNVYHEDRNCSHIKLSVKAVYGVPHSLRNDYGAKYYPCDYCCDQEEPGSHITYYITSDGTKYHIRRDCPKIKRSVREINRSEVGNRKPCKRCSN